MRTEICLSPKSYDKVQAMAEELRKALKAGVHETILKTRDALSNCLSEKLDIDTFASLEIITNGRKGSAIYVGKLFARANALDKKRSEPGPRSFYRSTISDERKLAVYAASNTADRIK